MNGYLITYQPKDDYGRTLFNHALFGRIVYKNYRGRKTGYYVPGLLDEKEHCRIKAANVFVKDLDDIDLELLNNYADIKITKDNYEDIEMVTGKIYWKNLAKIKGVILRDKKR